MAARTRSRLLKLLIALAALVVLGYLFMHSLETTRSEPYTVQRSQLREWTLVLRPAGAAAAPLLSLQANGQLTADLFRQLFQRAMESMDTPGQASIPIVLRGEFDRALGASMTPEALLAAAREAGLESAAHEPRCLAHRRVSEPGRTRQAYFAIVESPSIVRFRQTLAARSEGPLDAAALTPVMLVGASDDDFDQWLPLRAGDADCVAPIVFAGEK